MIYLKLKRKFFYKQNIYSKNLEEFKLKTFTKINQNFRIIEANYIDEKLLHDYSKKYRSKEHFEKNVKTRLKGTRFKGFAAIDEEEQKIAYLAWIDFDKIELNDANFLQKLKPNQAYFFDDHCVPEYRRKGLHKRVFEERMSFCKERKVNKIFIAMMNDNKIAINNLNKFCFELIESINVYPLSRLAKLK